MKLRNLKTKKIEFGILKKEKKGITNHIEIRTIGGTNYQRKSEQILNELDQFIEIFNRSLISNNQDEEYKNMLIKHMKVLKTAPQERREKFLQIIN